MDRIFPFERQTDRINDADLARLFAEPPGYDRFTKAVNHFLVGAKGSGKSALLRSASLPVLLRRHSNLDGSAFTGFYIPLLWNEGSVLSDNYYAVGASSVAEHYLSLRILIAILDSLRTDPRLSAAASDMAALIRTWCRFDQLVDALSFLRTARLDLGNVLVQDRSLTVNMIPFSARPITLEAITWLMQSVADTMAAHNLPPPCLLFDGYDFLCDELRCPLHSLMRKEYPFSTKIAARSIFDATDPPADIPSEWRRDSEVLVLDHNPHSQLYERLCLNAANAILAGKDIRALLADPRPRPEDYAGFDTFVQLSCGNVLTFLELCERALHSVPASEVAARTYIPSDKQHQAARYLSRRRLLEQIADESGESFRELRSFVFHAAQAAKGLPPDDPALRTMHFRLSGGVADPMASVLHTGFRYRHLVCSSADFMALNVTPDFLPQDLSLNSLFAAWFGLDLAVRARCEVTAEAVQQFMHTPTQFDHDHGKPQKPSEKGTHLQPSLFGGSGPVFISHPMSLKDKQAKDLGQRVKILKGAIAALCRKETVDPERLAGLDANMFCISAADIFSLSAPGFIGSVDATIRRARYVIHDITVPAPGVFYEMGLSVAYKKPFFLFFHEDQECWSPSVLPHAFGDLDVKRFARETAGISFREWVRRAFHSVAASVGEQVECSFNFRDPCELEDSIRSAPKNQILLAISPTEQTVRQVVRDVAVREFGMMVVDDWPPVGRATRQCAICAAARVSSCGIGLCDPGDAVNAFTLGVLQGLGVDRIVLWDRTQATLPPPAMSNAQLVKFTPATMEADVIEGVRKFLRSRKGG